MGSSIALVKSQVTANQIYKKSSRVVPLGPARNEKNIKYLLNPTVLTP